jgi:hypothetical protein
MRLHLSDRPLPCGRRRYRSSDRSSDGLSQLEGRKQFVMAQIAARLLPAAVPRLGIEDVFDEVSLFALLGVAAGTSQTPALSRAALNCNTGWLRGHPDSIIDDGGEDEEARDEAAANRIRFNTGVARVATRLLQLAPRAVPEMVLYPCPGGRAVDIARVAAATQPGTVRRLVLRGFYGSQADQVLEIWKLACATWGPSSLRDLRVEVPEFARCLFEDCIAAAQCPHLEVLVIPRIFLPLSFMASMVEGSNGRGASDPDTATPAAALSDLRLPSPTARRFDFAPYAVTLRSLELSHGPNDAAEFAFIATQLPSLRCLILAARKSSTGRISSGVWRRGMRQLLRQLHKLYILRLSPPLCRALNTLHTSAAAEAAQRSTAAGLPRDAMLQSDPDETDDSNDDAAPFFSTPADAGGIGAADATLIEDIPLQVFSIFSSYFLDRHSPAPFMRYLGRHAPCLTEVGLSGGTAEAAAELITMRGSCRAIDLNDVRGLTGTIVASILKRHRATLRQFSFYDVQRRQYSPRAYIDVLGDKDAPRGAPFTKIASVSLNDVVLSREQREYFYHLFPGLRDRLGTSIYSSRY